MAFPAFYGFSQLETEFTLGEMQMEPIKVYMDSENEGEIICPSCENKKIINVANYRIATKPIKVKCRCGYSFSIKLEHRRHHRRNVIIPGKLFHVDSRREADDILIKSISVTGVGFETKSLRGIKVGDTFEVAFLLKDSFDAAVRESVVVKRVQGNFIGAEFLEKDNYNYELDFYVMPQLSMT
jgi:PilZ domain-containing protein